MQMQLLGEISENWRAKSYVFAKELLHQANKLQSSEYKICALCKFGIYYVRKFDFDSAKIVLDSALHLSQEEKFKVYQSEALFWKAEIERQHQAMDSYFLTIKQSLFIANEINNLKRQAFCFVSMGEAWRITGEYDSAIAVYNNAITISDKINDLQRKSIAYNGLAEINRAQSNYPRALEYYNKALMIAEKNKNYNQVAFCLNGIADIYSSQKEFLRGIPFYERALKISEENNNKVQQCNSACSMGMNYFLIAEREQAVKYLNIGLKIAEETGNINKQVFAYNTLGNNYVKNFQDDIKAEINFKKALELALSSKNKAIILSSHNRIADFYLTTKKYNEALYHSQEALKLAQQQNILVEIKDAANTLSKAYAQNKNYKESLQMANLFIVMRDSINNEQNIKQLAAVEFQAKEEGLKAQQKAKEETFKAQQAKKEEELKRQKTLRYAFTGGFVLVLVLVIVVYKNLRLNKRKNAIITAQKKEVEHQREIVLEKNKEITDSINYAKRLQEAILPPLKMVKHVFPESFILYLPKDIIAGDFYWMEKSGDLVFYAAADSTGHGVPGALVSVVCSNALNRAVKEFKLTTPGQVLDKTRELVLETFEKSEGEVKDGMDISLLCFNSNTKELSWAGANNPLWYISGGVINEIKANKQPIGKTDNPLPFTTHKVNYDSGSIFYLFTDGYADQFGGDKGKKFKYKQLEELIINIWQKPMDEQKEILNTSFNNWKDKHEQVDDVTLIGVKF